MFLKTDKRRGSKFHGRNTAQQLPIIDMELFWNRPAAADTTEQHDRVAERQSVAMTQCRNATMPQCRNETMPIQ